MTRTPDVTANNPITDEWGNEIRDRTVQRYASAAARLSEHSSPEAGDMSYLADSGRVEVFHSAAWRAIGAVPTGAVVPYAGSSAPDGWLLCNGQQVSTSTYAELWAIIGYTFGGSGGSFRVPDLRQRFPLGVAESGTGNALGATGGAIDHRHSGPSHTHGVGSLATASAGSHSHSNPNTSTTGAHTHSGPAHTHSVGNTGSAGSHSHSAGQSNNNVAINYASGSTTTTRPTQIHSHTISSAGSHSHSVPNTSSSGTGATSSAGSHSHTVGNTGSAGAHTHGISGSVASGGTGNTGTANPPFIALNFIIKT